MKVEVGMFQPTCAKCGSDDVVLTYHKTGCDKRSCLCSHCPYGSNEKRHEEHLHYTCRRCRFDWTGDVLGSAKTAKGGARA